MNKSALLLLLVIGLLVLTETTHAFALTRRRNTPRPWNQMQEANQAEDTSASRSYESLTI
uniref:Uncharacterized protein n=1 Tax=Ciona intestinalis TaxID=7719 RepID=H2Y2U5_CIOIN